MHSLSSARPLDLALHALFLVVALAWLVRTLRRPSGDNPPGDDLDGRRLGPIDVACLAALALCAAATRLGPVFNYGTACFRVALADTNVFDDSGHPFLWFLLERPFTRLSLDPTVLRLPLIAYAVIETTLVGAVASRLGGRPAAVLAGVWFALELPRRHGLSDMSDWDLAGVFLMAQVAWLLRREARLARGLFPSTGDSLALGLLVAGGAMSSWLMVVPGALVVALLGIGAGARLREWARLLPALAAMALVVVPFASVYRRMGSMGEANADLGTLALDILREWPVGRTAWMALPLVAGLTWLAARVRSSDAARFMLAAIVAIPAAVLCGAAIVRVGYGYYVGLVTPLLACAAAVGTTTLTDRSASTGAPGRRYALYAAVIILTWIYPHHLPGADSRRGEHLPDFDRLTSRDNATIHVSDRDALRMLRFERARHGKGSLADVLDPGGDPRTRFLRGDDCPVSAPGSGAGAEGAPDSARGYLLGDISPALQRACAPYCEPIFPRFDGSFGYYRCR
jgi:hypothetical protein